MNLQKLTNSLFQLPTNLLVVTAHEDDEVIGSGGTIARNSRLGGTSHVICFGGSDETRRNEFEEACKILGATYETLKHPDGNYRGLNFKEASDSIVTKIIQHEPDYLITHKGEIDYHQDHRAIEEMVIDATIRAQAPQRGWTANGILGTETHPTHSTIHVFVDISEDYKTAQKALAMHKTQLEKLRNDKGTFYPEMYDLRTTTRGIQAGVKRAEAFSYQPIRLLGGIGKHNTAI